MKTTTTIIAAIMTFVMLSVFASAAVDVSYNTYSALYNTNGNFIPSTTPVNDVNVIGFVCADASCSTVSGSLWNGQVLNTGSDNQITLQYPTTLQSQYGYAVFYYKAGYLSWVQTSNWAGTGTVPTPEAKYLTKVETCRAPIDSFAVINDVYPNQPIMVDISASLDANTSSPLLWNNVVGYHPTQLASFERVNVTVTLTITNNAGQVVSTQQRVVSMDPSSTQRVQFDYTPTTLGQYTARVSTDVTDAKCQSSDTQFAQKNFNVITQNPTNQCYTLLNNLNVQPTNKTVGQPVTISFDKITNAYDAQGQLSTLATAANVNIVQNGQTVFTQQLVIPANTNTVVTQNAATTFTPQTAGYYTVTVNGFSQNCPYVTATADTVSQSFYAYTVFVPTNNTNTTNTTNNTTNQAPVWLTVPGVTLQQNSGLNANLFNLNLYVVDPDSNQLTFSIVSVSAPAVATCTVTPTGTVSCTAPIGGATGSSTIVVGATDGTNTVTSSFVVTVVPVVNPNGSCTGPNGVIIANTASQTFFQSASVPFGQTCVSESRTCSNGVLSGTFTQTTCSVQPPVVGQSCTGPDGAIIADGASTTYFQFATVPVGNVCTSQTRTCTNGALSGSFQFNSCIVGINTAPVWTQNPDLTIRRNANGGSIDLRQFVFDPEVPPQVLSFSVAPGTVLTNLGNAIASCTLTTSGILSCTTNHGQDDTVTINVTVSDGIASASAQVEIVVGIERVPSREKATNGLMIMQFHVPEYRLDEIENGRVPISVGLKNEGRRLKDVVVTATILETGARTTMDTFNLGASTQNVQLYIPLDTNLKPGMYTVRLTISDTETGMNRIEHRDLVIYN